MNASRQQIFVLEDQADIGRLVCRTLEDHGFRTEMFLRAGEFMRRIRVRQPNLCIIDLMLPDDDGLRVVQEIQSRIGIPIIIMSGRGDIVDRVLGLEIGADDYVVKPFDPRELVARVKAVLRRCEKAAPSAERDVGVAVFGAWSFDFGAHKLMSENGSEMELSAAEARLLAAMVKAPNRILTRDSLLGQEGRDERLPFDRSIDVRISRLRQKIEADPKNPQIIKTVYGAGYIFAAHVNWVTKDD